jgi:hypothetical protein
MKLTFAVLGAALLAGAPVVALPTGCTPAARQASEALDAARGRLAAVAASMPAEKAALDRALRQLDQSSKTLAGACQHHAQAAGEGSGSGATADPRVKKFSPRKIKLLSGG